MKPNEWADVVEESRDVVAKERAIMNNSRERLRVEILRYKIMATKAEKAGFYLTALLIDDTIQTLQQIIDGDLYR